MYGGWTWRGISSVPDPAVPENCVGSKDGSGAADHDKPYEWGHRPRVRDHSPFTEMQFARLLILRGRLQDRPDLEDWRYPGEET